MHGLPSCFEVLFFSLSANSTWHIWSTVDYVELYIQLKLPLVELLRCSGQKWKRNLESCQTLSRSKPLTIPHGVRVGQAEAGQVDHAVGQVDVEASHCCLQVAQLVQYHHASLHHRHHGSSCWSRRRRHREGAVTVGHSVYTVFHRILLGKIPQEGQLLQACHSLWKKEGKG